jgi:hypothetical protein
MQVADVGEPPGRATSQRQSRNSRRTHQGSTELAIIVGIVALLFVMIWALNLESRLPSLRIAEQPPAGTTQKILEPGTYHADDPAIVRSGNWFTQTLGTTSSTMPSASMVTSTSGSAMSLMFYGTDLSMDARIGPESGEVRVTVDGQTSSVLPSDSTGSFVDLSGSQAEEESILIATGLAHRDHSVVIRSSSNADVAISGFVVTSSTPFPWAFTTLYAGLATLMFVLVRLTVLMISRDRGWLR